MFACDNWLELFGSRLLICLLVTTGSNYLVPDFLLEKDLDLDLITPL